MGIFGYMWGILEYMWVNMVKQGIYGYTWGYMDINGYIWVYWVNIGI